MPIEILAPAGGPDQLAAALAAGAEAVYFGLGELDARRGAAGFNVAELATMVAQVHAAGAKAHLTLNIQVGHRELGRAARTLAWAAQCGIDAVLVADPGLFAVARACATAFPTLQVHASTQAGVSSSAGVALLHGLGARRVVLAREMSLDEIGACTACGPEIEVFAQGALCFSVSGRCSLTSWVGGHSGNRGTCTSICRVGWSCNGGERARPMDMKDVSAVRLVPELAARGVTSLKIEGRLKSPTWVGEAVGLFRRAATGDDPAALWEAAARLGAYTGREMTEGYLSGRRVGLVHPDGGRAASSGEPAQDDQDPPRVLHVVVSAAERGLLITLTCGAAHHSFTATRSEAHRGRDATVGGLAVRLRETLPPEVTLGTCVDQIGNLRLPRRSANDLAAQITAWCRPERNRIDRLKVTIPEAMRVALDPGAAHPANVLPLSTPPDRARVDAEAALTFAAAVPAVGVVVELRHADGLAALAALGDRLVVALPPVIYEAMIPGLRALCAACVGAGRVVEANGWDGLHLAREAGAVIEGGPGLPAYNPVAARVLGELGCTRVYAAVEADGTMLADLCARCPVPLTLPVYGRPALMTTRAWSNAPGWAMEDDRRTVRIRTRQEGPVVVLRPEEAFDWRGRRGPGLLAAHREMDLTAAPDALAAWLSRPAPTAPLFNLDRELA
jgi:putative protease